MYLPLAILTGADNMCESGNEPAMRGNSVSTIFFGSYELGAMAVMTVGNTSSSDGKRHLESLCSSLADYSKANAAAYSERYNEPCDPWNADDILESAQRLHRDDTTLKAKRSTASSARLLRYNLDECATVDALHAVVSVLTSTQFRIYSAPDVDESGVRPWR